MKSHDNIITKITSVVTLLATIARHLKMPSIDLFFLFFNIRRRKKVRNSHDFGR